MKLMLRTRMVAAALMLALAGCGGGGSSIQSPGASSSGAPPGGGTGGGTGGGGGGTASCPTGTTNQGGLGALTICQVTGRILTSLTLPRLTNVVYRLSGRVDVGVDIGGAGNAAGGQSATLTIEPGVTLFGESGSDYLLINRGSRIIADGTVSDPIVFTSRSDLEGTADPLSTIGQWGGVVILGRAPIRGCNTAVTQGTVGCENEVEGVATSSGSAALYGGATPTDNSGKLEYVQVRYAGFALPGTAGNELNGITFGGVGSGTEVDFIQVHNNADDGVEFFGGTVNVRHLVLTGNDDDSLDYDEGYQGNIQFVVTRQRPGAGDRLVEASNRTVSSSGGTLQTNPTIANFTFVGTPTRGSTALLGIDLNNTLGTPGSSGRYANGIVTGSTTCAKADQANTSPAPTFNSVLFDCPTQPNGATLTLINNGANNSTNVANTLSAVFLPGGTEQARPAVTTTTLGSFFTAANYIGAFSPAETISSNWTTGWTLANSVFPDPGCPAGTTESGQINSQRRCVLTGTLGTGNVPANVRLTFGNIYQVVGRVNVGVDRGGAGTGGTAASLTIDAGVTTYGSSGSDYIIVNRGSQIFVNGTRNSPVVMTSLADLTNAQANPTNAIGEWGGLVVLGRAPIRGCNTAVTQGSVDCQNEIEGVATSSGAAALYGGATAADNSGRIEYLQVRYAGFALPGTAGNELNGITFGGVGSGTVVNYIQVHNNADDGVEFFGGTVNAKYIVLTGNDDDSLDYDEGYQGKLQFIITTQRTGAGDRLVEASNRTVSSSGGTLQSNPTIANFTFVGTPTRGATQLLGIELNTTLGTPGASGRYINGVVKGSTTCVKADAVQPPNAVPTPAPVFNSVLFNCVSQPNAATLTLLAAGTNNTTTTTDTLQSVFINGATETGRPALNPNTVDPYFTSTTYIGAVRDTNDNWWRTWTCGLEAANC